MHYITYNEVTTHKPPPLPLHTALLPPLLINRTTNLISRDNLPGHSLWGRLGPRYPLACITQSSRRSVVWPRVRLRWQVQYIVVRHGATGADSICNSGSPRRRRGRGRRRWGGGRRGSYLTHLHSCCRNQSNIQSLTAAANVYFSWAFQVWKEVYMMVWCYACIPVY